MYVPFHHTQKSSKLSPNKINFWFRECQIKLHWTINFHKTFWIISRCSIASIVGIRKNVPRLSLTEEKQ